MPIRIAAILTDRRHGNGGRTKSSSAAEPLLKLAFLGDAFMVADMSMRSVRLASLLNSASNVDRKGLRDMGLLAELERSDWFAGEGKPGEVALLRKGLLEDRLRERPGDGRRSAADKVSGQERRRAISKRPNFVTEGSGSGETGVDKGPYLALTVPRACCCRCSETLQYVAIMPNQTREAGRLQVTAGR